MAYINVVEWTPDQVTDWLKGLDNSMYKYINAFTNNEVKGHALLNIRPYELIKLGMSSIGHQEIVLEAVEQLRNFSYNLEKENLQFLALQVATTTKNLYKQLAYDFDKRTIRTEILNDITRAISTIKPLVGWLDRSPFQGQLQFNEIRKRILQLGIEMATSAQRDRFVENPVDQIRLTAEKLSKLADYIIQDISDPMILQPATLNLVTLKKRESDLGFNIIPNYHGIHVITDIKYNSPAHISGKIEDGDEIIQINYQTVVGWHYKRVIQQLQESPPDVLLTLKKRPKHTKIYGQIYMKPYRLPSKKRSAPYRLDENLPSPRIDLISSQNFSMLLPLVTEKAHISDIDSSSTDSIASPEKSLTRTNEKDLRLYLPKPRAVLQRRNTICGDQVAGYRGNVIFWREMDNRNEQDSPSLRDKSISFGFGLETTSRPTTCIGIHHGAFRGSLLDMKQMINNCESATQQKGGKRVDKQTEATEMNECDAMEKQSKNKAVKFSNEEKTVMEKDTIATIINGDATNEIKENFVKDTEKKSSMERAPRVAPKTSSLHNESELCEAVNTTLVSSHNQQIETKPKIEDKPPEISPRREFLQRKEPPIPPPRPSKAAELLQRKLDLLKHDRVAPPPPPSAEREHSPEKPPTAAKPSIGTIIETKQKTNEKDNNSTDENSHDLPTSKHFLEEKFEGLELLTPNNSKTLTLKKKNSIFAKRRKISLKQLEISEIQGHLFRRTKDKNGVTYWAKLYFVLVESSLYGFREKQSTKANCLIFLSGFTVSLAKEVHSKQFAYKVYHPKKTFYFAAETEQALVQWMEYIRRATLKGNTVTIDPMLDTNSHELYSETDSSEDEATKDISNSPLFHKTESNGKAEKTASPSTSGKYDKYHLSFGTFTKKLTKHSLPFTLNKSTKESDEKKKNSSEVPVPTAQFRSYRKIHGNAGMQLGSVDFMALNKPAKNLPSQLTTVSTASTMKSPIVEKILATPPSTPPTKTKANAQFMQRVHEPFEPISTEVTAENMNLSHVGKSSPRLVKNKTAPFNYMHASNPNLVEFTFQTSKTLDYSQPKINPSNNFDAQHNLQGFITLKDLMLQHEEAEAHNMYANRVNLGVEKVAERDASKSDKNRTENQNGKTEATTTDNEDPDAILFWHKIQGRRLPKTPDDAQSFKANDRDIILARSKEGQKLRDFGYEFISGDDSNSSSNQQMSPKRNLIGNMSAKSKPNDRGYAPSTKRKGLGWINFGEKHSAHDERQHSTKNSFKLIKGKVVTDAAVKTTHENIDPLQANESGAHKLERSQSSAAATIDNCESLISNRERRSSVDRNTNYFSKLSFPSNKSAKEKRLLGSPRLHRAIFGRKVSDQSIDHEPFSSVENNSRSPVTTSSNSSSAVHSTVRKETHPIPALISRIPEVSDTSIEYPPVFEPETYSLNDPSSSSTLFPFYRNVH